MQNPEHVNHDSSKAPVAGCPDCDREIGRPIPRRHGLGSSSVVIPRPPGEKEPSDG